MPEIVPVSAIVPAYQAELYLAEAIESILGQSAVPRQIVVVDDGSTDATLAVARRFSAVTVLTGPHAGIAAALNRAVAAAHEPYLAFLDADDLWLPQKIEKQWQRLHADDAPDLVFGGMVQFFSPDAPDELRRRVVCPPEAAAGLISGTLFTSRAVFDQVGWFSTEWRVGSFVDWCARAAERGLRRCVLPEVVLRRRLHGGNIGLRQPEARVDFARVVKAALDRRRRKT